MGDCLLFPGASSGLTHGARALGTKNSRGGLGSGSCISWNVPTLTGRHGSTAGLVASL